MTLHAFEETIRTRFSWCRRGLIHEAKTPFRPPRWGRKLVGAAKWKPLKKPGYAVRPAGLEGQEWALWGVRGAGCGAVAKVEFGLNLENRMQCWEKYRGLLENLLEVIGSCAGVWSRFSKMKARQQELGAIVADLDLLIAATAAHHQRTVATLNSRDFSRIEEIAWEEWSAVS